MNTNYQFLGIAMNDKPLTRKQKQEIKQQREKNREKQSRRTQTLKEQNIKKVMIEVSAADIDKLMQATGLKQKHALTKCVEIGVQSLTQANLFDDGFSKIAENENQATKCVELVNELHTEVQAAISTAEAQNKNWHNNRIITAKLDIVKRLADTLDIDLLEA